MAQKRMFNNLVIGSDDFLEMPDSSQNLYFHLSMSADDDGFVDNWKSVMRMTGKKEDDLKILITKSFIIPFDTGILVIKHWRLNNYIQKDRYKETIHKREKALLSIDTGNVYKMDTECIQNVSVDKIRLDKIRLDKSSSNNINTDKENDSCVDGFQNENDGCVDDFQKVIDFYCNNIGTLTPHGLSVLESYKGELNIEIIIFAMEKAVEANKRNINYIKAILNNWSKAGIKTIVEAKEESERFKKRTDKTNNNQRIYGEADFLNLYAN